VQACYRYSLLTYTYISTPNPIADPNHNPIPIPNLKTNPKQYYKPKTYRCPN